MYIPIIALLIRSVALGEGIKRIDTSRTSRGQRTPASPASRPTVANILKASNSNHLALMDAILALVIIALLSTILVLAVGEGRRRRRTTWTDVWAGSSSAVEDTSAVRRIVSTMNIHMLFPQAGATSQSPGSADDRPKQKQRRTALRPNGCIQCGIRDQIPACPRLRCLHCCTSVKLTVQKSWPL